MQYDLNLIRVVVAVADAGHVSAAARALGMSQPGLSSALKRARETYNDPLFIRTPRGMQPTPRALPLIDAAREIIELHRTKMLGAAEFSPLSSQTEVRFAMSDVGEMVFLPRLMEHFKVHAPHVTVRVVVVGANDLWRALEDGDIDLAVGYFPDLSGPSIFQQALFSHGFACLARSNHPRIEKRLTRKLFLELEHAVVHAAGRSQEVFEQYLSREHIKRRVVLNVPHFMSIPYVIASGDLIVTVPLAVGMAFASLAHLKLLKPPFEIPRFDLKQHWHRRLHKDPRNRWLRNQIALLFNSDTDAWRGIQVA